MSYGDSKFMREALIEAQRAYDIGEVPIGAIIVMGSDVLARAHNSSVNTSNPINHAEIIAINSAVNIMIEMIRHGKIQHKKDGAMAYLKNCDIYVTLEPCIMCAAAISIARINRVYFGAYSPKYGGTKILSASIDVYGGIMEKESSELLQKFFKNIRVERYKDSNKKKSNC